MIIENSTQLEGYKGTVASLENQLAQARQEKAEYLQELQKSYTKRLKGKFIVCMKSEKGGPVLEGQVGQIERVFTKHGTLFAHMRFLCLTSNAKVTWQYLSVGLFEGNMGRFEEITEGEYKTLFSEYVLAHMPSPMEGME